MEGISSLLAKYLLSTSKAFKALLSARQANYQFLFDLEKAERLQIACEVAHQETSRHVTSQKDSESLALVCVVMRR